MVSLIASWYKPRDDNQYFFTLPSSHTRMICSLALWLLFPILAIGRAKVYNNPMDLRKKLIYQSRHRGTRENDLLLGSFADAVLPNLSEADLRAYQDMLGYEDADLFAWITGQQPIPENDLMIRRVRDFHQCR
jgi:antitoxin CptB